MSALSSNLFFGVKFEADTATLPREAGCAVHVLVEDDLARGHLVLYLADAYLDHLKSGAETLQVITRAALRFGVSVSGSRR